MNKRMIVLMVLVAASCPALKVFAQVLPVGQDLTQLSMQDLMNVKVYSAAKMPERLFKTAAAIYVITPEDIRRSGATNIPELLRMVPGISVQQINSHSWDIAARGFNGSVFSNKLLVLIDGRVVYTPLYGGVLWELQDYVLEDIERIEVIRGPGGTLWGANAVNGVINIITKKAKDTQGGLISQEVGTLERDMSTVRYGAKTGDWFYRAYAKYFDYGEGYRASGTARDTWQAGRTGFRAEKDNLTLQGDFYQEYLGGQTTLSSLNPPYVSSSDKTVPAQGGNFLTRYATENWSLQTYWEATNENFQDFSELRNIFDTEYNQHAALSLNQTLSWGLGYRLNLEDIKGTPTVTINKPGNTDELFSAYLQDEIKMFDDRLTLTIGSKFEQNIYTHFEFEPNVRMAYDINERNMIWTAASRAVRTPSRLEVDGQTLSSTDAPTLFISSVGNHHLISEKLDSYEIGYRTQPIDNLSFDFSGFANHYDHLITYNLTSLTPTIENGMPFYIFQTVNGQEGDAFGVELSNELKLTDWWKIKTSYTYTKLNITDDVGITNVGFISYLEDAVPRHSVYLRSSFDLSHGYELDTTLRYMDAFQGGSIPDETQLDINLEKTIKQWQIAIVGENLLRPHHRESFGGVSSATTQIPRSAYVKVTYKF